MPRRDEKAAATMILERSLLAGIASLVPVPLVDDYLLRRARSALLKDVAKRAGVQVADDALAELSVAPATSAIASAGIGLIGRALRGAALPLRLIDRARAAVVTFQRATLFDHYVRHHHHGATLSLDDAKALRARMDLALTSVPLSSWRVPAAHADALRSAFDTSPQRALAP